MTHHWMISTIKNLDGEHHLLEEVYRKDELLLHGGLFPLHFLCFHLDPCKPEDLDNGSKACVPFLKLLHHQSIPSNENVQYLVFICLVVLWIREREYLPNADTAASSIEDQIKDDGGLQGSASFNIARKLAKIIDEYTTL